MSVSGVLLLAGGIALFLFGMSLMGDGLKKVAGNRLELVLYKLTGTPLKGILLGTGVTAVIQSSSATSVMVVGFVNSGMMKVKQAIGVVMGAIVGTSITGWIICLSSVGGSSAGWLELLSTDSLAAITALAGILFYMFSKDAQKKHMGSILLGFSVLMFGMKTMSGAVSDLRENEAFIGLLTRFSNPILGILVGTAFTSILQSASAAIGILQALSSTGAITFSVALPMIMGIAIGAAVPVLMSALGAKADGKRTAWSYLAVDLLGVILVSILFYAFNAALHFSFMSMQMSSVNIALVNTLFRVLIVVLLSPAIGLLERLMQKIIKDDPEEKQLADVDRLEERFLAHPPLAIEQCRITMESMAHQAQENVSLAMKLLAEYTPEGHAQLEKAEEAVDHYEDALGTYLVKLMRMEMDKVQNEQVTKYLHAITDFERISDHAVNIGESAKELYEKKISFSGAGEQEIATLRDATLEIMNLAVKSFTSDDIKTAYRIEPLEELTDNLCDEMKLRHIQRIRQGICTLEHGFVFNDLLTNFERIGDHCSNVGIALIELASDELETHQYTTALMAGRSHGFDTYYAEYAQKYQI